METLDNPGLSRRWQGRPQEKANLQQMVHQFLTFSWQEIKTGWQKLRRK